MATKKVRVLIDHQIFSLQTFGGISRMFTELFKRFQKGNQIESRITTKFSDNDYLTKIMGLSSVSSGKKNFVKTLFYYGFNTILTVFHLLRKDYDIFQPTYYDPYFLPLLGKKPFVLVVYDMTHEIYPETASKRDKTILWKRKLVHRAEKIVAISENTKKDIMKFYDIDASKIEVIYLASSLKKTEEELDMAIPKRYILFVGNRSKYKNFENFFKAVIPLLKKDEELSLVCAGSGKFTEEEESTIRKNSLGERVLHISFKEDRELAHLYQNALCFVFPSLYEGFGIPALEAFSCDCPVLLSNTSSLPEVGGDAVVYFDPHNIKSIQKSIQQVVYDESLRKELVMKGKERLKLFTWVKAADKFACVYKELEGKDN